MFLSLLGTEKGTFRTLEKRIGEYMTTYLAIEKETPITPLAAGDAQRIRDYVADSKAASTRRIYQSDWRHFTTWCAEHGFADLLPIAPEILAAFLTELADDGRAVATIARKLAAITFAHELAEVEITPRRALVTRTMEGIRRRKGTAPKQMKALLTPDIRALVMGLPASMAGVRDRALLLIGYAGAFRRSELVALNVEDIEEDDEGLRIHLRRSKTDQAGAGQWKGIPRGAHLETCPVRAYQAWLFAAGVVSGPAFRRVDRHGRVHPDRLNDRGVARAVKQAAEAAGLDPKKFAAHSLRRGFVTAAHRAGVDVIDIMAQTGHKKIETVQRYIEKEKVLGKRNAARRVGL